jgi:carboxylesterase type B
VPAARKTAIAIASGVLALGAGIGVAGLAYADPTPTPSATNTPSGTPSPGTERGGWPGHRGPRGEASDLAKELASKLGIDEAKVADALRSVWEENKPTSPPDRGSRPDPSERAAALAKALASKLGIDEQKIKTALDEIRAEHQTEWSAAVKAKLDAAVKDGKLTQAEADAVQKAFDEGVINFGRR